MPPDDRDIARDDAEGLLKSALAARGRGDLAEAIADFRRLCDLRPSSPGPRCELAFTLLRSGELDEAEALCRAVLTE
jgi:Flp pilus assembly protein TadD